MNSFIVGLLLIAAPLAFAAFLLFFMMSGKGTKPLDKNGSDPEADSENEDTKKVIPKNQDDF